MRPLLVIADHPLAQVLGGFKATTTTFMPCRRCMVSPDNLFCTHRDKRSAKRNMKEIDIHRGILLPSSTARYDVNFSRVHLH